MKIENQVCTLEQAKKLQQLGIEQNTHYWWDEGDNVLYRCIDRSAKDIGCFAAFTVAELGIALPDYKPSLGNLEIGKCETDHITMKPIKKSWWNASYWTWENEKCTCGRIHIRKTNNYLQQYPTLAQSLAALLIHLLENNLITAEEVNCRLSA